MPLPLILGAGAAVASAVGVGAAVTGASKMKKANDVKIQVKIRHEQNIARFEEKNIDTTRFMDALGERELKILDSFDEFTSLIEKIHNKPEFKAYEKSGVEIPKYDAEELNKVAVGAAVLLGGLGGAAVGTAGGFAAAGVTTSAVMALGTASTGTAIASLSGVAATNATLAALGGGALAAGGGGMALGTTILGATTLGVGLLVGGILFNGVSSKVSEKAEEAEKQMLAAEKEINEICDYLVELLFYAKRFDDILTKVNAAYKAHVWNLKKIIEVDKKYDWDEFSDAEKLITENTVLLVGLLYNMCKVQLVLKSEKNDGLNKVNISAIDRTIIDANNFLTEKGFEATV